MEENNTTYKPLYLKYRPLNLEQLVGQSSVKKTLNNALENNRIAHAYLFTGPRGTGKTSSARILAKSINCDDGPTISPCLKCPSCEAIKNSSSPSVFEIDAASNNSVDDARSLIERAPLATQDGKHKLYIIDECHMLTKEAFNALLKTIEEPPPNVVFILATTEEHKVPPTIVSRCQRLMFRLVSQPELAEHLKNVAEQEKIAISDDALELMSRRSGGGLRDALGLLDQASLLSKPDEPVQASDLLILLGALDEDRLLEISEGIQEENGQKVLEQVNKLLMQGREPSLITTELAKHFLALTKASYLKKDNLGEEAIQFISGSKDYVEKVVDQAKNFDRTELSQIVELLDQLEQRIKRSSQPSLSLEMGMLSICHRLAVGSVKEMATKIKRLETMLEQGDFDLAKTSSTAARSAPPPKESVHKEPQREVEKPAESPRVEEPARQPEPSQPPHEPAKEDKPVFEEPETPIHRQQEEEDTETGSKGASISELEELWSDLLDALHKRSIPAYSLVQMHANPIGLENNQLTLGVSKEFFQKSIEGKATHIQQAYKTLTGNEITVKVKVLAEADLSKKKSKSDSQPINRPPPEASRASEPEPEPEPEPDSNNGKTEQTAPETASKEPEDGSELDQPEKETPIENKAPPASGQKKLSEPAQDSSLINEAYRLFEGPGSRIIG